MSHRYASVLLVVALTAQVALVNRALAQTALWANPAGGDFNDDSNWIGGPPDSAISAIFADTTPGGDPLILADSLSGPIFLTEDTDAFALQVLSYPVEINLRGYQLDIVDQDINGDVSRPLTIFSNGDSRGHVTFESSVPMGSELNIGAGVDVVVEGSIDRRRDFFLNVSDGGTLTVAGFIQMARNFEEPQLSSSTVRASGPGSLVHLMFDPPILEDQEFESEFPKYRLLADDEGRLRIDHALDDATGFGAAATSIQLTNGILEIPETAGIGDRDLRGYGVYVGDVNASFAGKTINNPEGQVVLTHDTTLGDSRNRDELVTFFSLGPARIDDGATVDIPNQGASASGFQVGDNARLSGELTGDVELQNGILMSSSVAGDVTGHGVVVGAGPTIAFPNGPVSLTRDLAVGGAAEIYSTLPAHLGPRTTIVGGTLVADNGVLLGANDELRGSGAVEASITGAAASLLHADGGDLEVGDATAASGFQTDGSVVVDVAGRLVIHSASRARLGGETVVDGILAAAGGVAISAGGTLSGSGTVDAPVAGESGSTIRPTGNLALGASAADGFAFAGMLEVGGNNVRLFDADQAVLGSLTTIDAGGTLRADNGVVVDFGRTITGAGVVNSLDNAQQATIINGLAAGASAGQPLTFAGYVKGVGTFADVVFNGTFAPGLSPAAVETGSLAFGAESVLEIELGGMTPGAQYDQLLVDGSLHLDGTLSVSLLNGFQPEEGAQFEILTYESLSGDFDRVEFVGPWRGAVAFGDSAALLTIWAVPEPGTAVLGALAILMAIGRCSYRRIWLASTRQAAGGRIAN